VLTVCDNVMDMLLPDQGPAKRLPLAAMTRAPMLEAPTVLGGKAADVPLAQHGFSALVEVRKGGRGGTYQSAGPAGPAGSTSFTGPGWRRSRRRAPLAVRVGASGWSNGHWHPNWPRPAGRMELASRHRRASPP
jgi:hypothetical protein